MKYIFILFFLGFSFFSTAQYEVSGTVVNGKDNTPLAGASVFINNASKGTTADAEGNFKLSGISVANFELVISFVNYQTLAVKITPENINKRFSIQMEPKPQELQEVVIGPVLKDGWQQWGKTFTDFFIGTSKNAGECIIKNPEVVRFRYNKKEQILRVTAVDKLQIENKALGLIIDYQLEEFRYEGKAGMISFYGYSSFKKMESKRKRKQQNWIDNRREAYNGSLMHFIRSVYNNNTEQEGFEIRQLIRLNKNDSAVQSYYDSIIHGYNTVFDTSLFAIQLMKTNNFAKDPVIYIIGKQPLATSAVRIYDTASKALYLYFRNNLQVLYKNGFEKEEYAQQSGLVRRGKQHQQSVLDLTNDRAVMIEKNGLYEPLDIFSEGYIAWEKIAEMLPSDYEPGD